MNWHDANNFCKADNGAHLAEIKSDADNSALREFLDKNGILEDSWIGLKDSEDSPNEFTWQSSEEPLRYDNWYENEPTFPENPGHNCVKEC